MSDAEPLIVECAECGCAEEYASYKEFNEDCDPMDGEPVRSAFVCNWQETGDLCDQCHDEKFAQWYVNLYRVTRHKGGPEEGGWWYDRGEPKASIPLSRYRRHKDLEVRTIVREISATMKIEVGGGRRFKNGNDYTCKIEPHMARDWPAVRPHYE